MIIKWEDLLRRYEPEARKRLVWQLVRDRMKNIHDILYSNKSWVHSLSTVFKKERIYHEWRDCMEVVEKFLIDIEPALLLSWPNGSKKSTDWHTDWEPKVWWSNKDDWYDAAERLAKLWIDTTESTD